MTLPQKESKFISYLVKQKTIDSMATLGMIASIETTNERKCEDTFLKKLMLFYRIIIKFISVLEERKPGLFICID